MSLGSEDDVKDMQVKNKRDNIKVGLFFLIENSSVLAEILFEKNLLPRLHK